MSRQNNLDGLQALHSVRDKDVAKSYEDVATPVHKYCTERTVRPEPLLQALQKKTLKEIDLSIMLGAPEVFQIGQNFIRLIDAKKALDVGTFTGASAAAWALALPEDGRVISMDVTHKFLDVTRSLIDARKDVAKKIDFKLAPALETLDALIAKGEAGTWDFAFIDADKDNYSNYYERVITLLRPKGVLLIDNALWCGEAVAPKSETAKAVDAANRVAEKDSRTDNFLINLADGLHVVFKR